VHLRFEMPLDNFAVDVYMHDALSRVVKEKPYHELVPGCESPGQKHIVYIVSLRALSNLTIGCTFT
jgi:hypothetical protein